MGMYDNLSESECESHGKYNNIISYDLFEEYNKQKQNSD